MDKREIKTKEEAREYAIDWQQWASEQNLSWAESTEWNHIFEELADRFDLREEFKENGII